MPACATADDDLAMMEQEDRRIDYIPTSHEISLACAQIRARWSLNEKRRRFVGELVPDNPTQDWRPPVIDTSAFRLAMTPGRENA